MAKTYDPAPQEVHDRVAELIRRFHPDLEKLQVRIDILMAATDGDSPAVTCSGYSAYAVVKILGPKERAMGRGDAEIVIDRDAYEAMDSDRRDALIDHELYHLEPQRDKVGQPKRDDYHRPVMKLRKHDFQVGWFHEIARRHGPASIEVMQSTTLKEEHAQLYLAFASDDTGTHRRVSPFSASAKESASEPRDVETADGRKITKSEMLGEISERFEKQPAA